MYIQRTRVLILYDRVHTIEMGPSNIIVEDSLNKENKHNGGAK